MANLIAGPNAFVSPREAARIKGCSPQAVTRAIREGRLKADRCGQQYVIRRGDLDAWQPSEAHKRRVTIP